jgi:antitoxin PrlF
MFVSEKGQVTIPKAIRMAAGVVAGAEVVCSLERPQTCRFAPGPPRGMRKLGSGPAFSHEGGKIVITPVATSVRGDRRGKLRAAAAQVRASLNPEFAQLDADEIMDFLRGE